MPPSEPIPGLGSGGRISYVDFLLHKAQLGAMPSHPLLHFLRRSLALGQFHWPTRFILASPTIISGEVTSRSTKEVSSPGSTTTWSSARRCGPSRRQGRHVDGSLLPGQIELDEMTGARKQGSQLTSLAASAQPQARRRLLPSSASSRGGPSAERRAVFVIASSARLPRRVPCSFPALQPHGGRGPP